MHPARYGVPLHTAVHDPFIATQLLPVRIKYDYNIPASIELDQKINIYVNSVTELGRIMTIFSEEMGRFSSVLRRRQRQIQPNL